MVKQDGNIDIVFRDGLRNLEVLPPADAWAGISKEINTRASSRGSAFRVAAGIAALISLGLLSYFVGIRSSQNILEPLAVEDIRDDGSLLVDNQDNSAVMLARAEPTGTTQQQEAGGTENITLRNSETNSPLTLAYNRIQEDHITTNTGNSRDIIVPESIKTNYNSISLNQAGDSDVLSEVELSESNSGNERWMLGAKLSPTYLSTNLKAANSQLGTNGDGESAIMSYTGGISVSYAMGGRLSLQTGLYYSSLGRQISGINSYSGFAGLSESKGGKLFGVQTSSGEISSTNQDIFLADATGNRISSIYSEDSFDPVKADLQPLGSSLRQSFEYIEVPLILSYKLIDRKVDFNISGGLAYNFLINNSTYAVADKGFIEIGSTEDLSPLLLSSAFAMSMEYSISNRFSFNVEPTFRYFMNSDGRLTSNNPFTFGLFSGFFYKF